MRITRLSVDQAFASLHSAREGLASAEAARRLAEYGPNRVEELAREPLWLKGAWQFTHFFALILLFAAGLAFYAEAHGPGQGMATLGWAIIGVVVVNVFLCRDPRQSVFAAALKYNPLILFGILVELALILVIVYSAPGNAAFAMAPIALEVWLFMLPFASAMLVLEEGRKWWLRRRV